MGSRLKLFLWILFISIDQLIYTIVWGLVWVITANGETPNPDETISSRVGRKAIEGRPWALFLEKIINAFFAIFGEKDHCRNSIEEFYSKETLRRLL